jgi:hypothetical protein
MHSRNARRKLFRCYAGAGADIGDMQFSRIAEARK